MDNLISDIRKNIPSPSRILGYYDDEEERWVKFLIGIEIIGINQINKSLKFLIKEIEKIKEFLGAEKIDFVMEINVDGYRMNFEIGIEEKDSKKSNNFVKNVIYKIRRVNKISKKDEVVAKFTKLTLTF